MKILASALALLSGLALATSGCASNETHARPRVTRTVIVERNTVVHTVADSAPDYENRISDRAEDDEEGEQVTEVMPAPRQEVIVVRPSKRHVWIAGYWRWERSRYVWVGGHWMLPPRADVVWVGPRVVVRHGAKVYVHGCWRHHRRH